jgi:hypothetical protein
MAHHVLKAKSLNLDLADKDKNASFLGCLSEKRCSDAF